MAREDGERRLLYGRRRGHTLSPRQRGLFDERLPALAIDPAAVMAAPVAAMEIGFGGGEHLLHEAARHPDWLFLGCEPFENGVASLIAGIEETKVRNIRLHCGDARDILARLDAACLDRIDILYPDPWPKRRHRKRRFFGEDTLNAMARGLKPGGIIRFASDIDHYVGWTLARIAAHPAFVWEARDARDWLDPWEGWPGTRYEAKAIAAGRRPSYLIFRRRADEIGEA
ncbi:MAG: tRNA (guanosine(46)-N7)-methyltransferase TrmB [Rhodobiaceae bacterium]|nr:tRNA (guanosine(46)-N7)-methyltransferase TrmB [Rhodobiaceae bacterium]